ncbi:hypothetical protein V502_08765 [Pseudogymnoascus sp. VKM F-4520 (FW-2644)]|nr:hypothetical protein V502_08765 [Pseudogymnoascus sp. VKM F-4520 (FW-2644)]
MAAANPPISPPPYEGKSPRTPRFSGSNPLGIPNFGTPVKIPRKITKERTRHDTPGSVVNASTFSANPDVVKELLPYLAKGWAPEETSGRGLLCGVYALSQAFKNVMGVSRAPKGFGVDSLKDGIKGHKFRTFHIDVIKRRLLNTGTREADLDRQVKQMMVQAGFGNTNFYSVEQLSEFVRYINKTNGVQYRLGIVTSHKEGLPSAYIVESDDPFKELHYRVLWLHNIDNSHWESFGPNSSRDGRKRRRNWKLLGDVKRVVNNGLYRVKIATEGDPKQYTLTALMDQWVYQVAPPLGLEPRDGFIYVHTTKGPNSDSWRVIGKSTMDTIRDQEGYIPMANLEEVESYKDDAMKETARTPTDILAGRIRPKTPPPPTGEKPTGPITPGPVPGGNQEGGLVTPGPTPGRTPGDNREGGGITTPGPPQGPTPGDNREGGGLLTPGPTPGDEELPDKGTIPSGLSGHITIDLPPTPNTDGPTVRGPPVPPVIQIQEPPAILQPTPLPEPRPKVIGPNTPLTIQTFLARRAFAPRQHPYSTRGQFPGSRPRLPTGRPKSRTMAEFTATRNRKNDWANTRFLNFFLADVPTADLTGRRFGVNHDQPYHQDQVLLSLDETYEPDVPGPVRVRTIDEDEGWAHSANLRKVIDPFGLDLNAATTQYSMDPNEAFREDLYPTAFLRGLCQGSGVDPRGTRQEVMAGLTAHRMELGVPLILYRLVEAMGTFARDDLVRVPGDPLAHPEEYFRAFGLEPHKRGYVRGRDLVAEPKSWGARVRPHVHELTAPYDLKWAEAPDSVEDLVPPGSKLTLHGVDTVPDVVMGEAGQETERERQEREAGFAPAATVIPSRHPGQVYTAKDGAPSFFTPLVN